MASPAAPTSTGAAGEISVRPARADERVAVLSVLDAAMLETDASALAARIEAGSVLVAVADGRVLGAVEVNETGDADASETAGGRVEAVAVRPGRRGQGIGSRLLAAAHERWRPLSAAFDADVRPFYERLGFEVRALDGERDEESGAERYRGVLH